MRVPKISKGVKALLLIWIFTIVALYSTNLTIKSVDLQYYPGHLSKSPSGKKIILQSREYVKLYDSNLKELGSFFFNHYGGYWFGLEYHKPEWTPDEQFLVVHSETTIYYLDGNNLAVIYRVEKSELGIRSFSNEANFVDQNLRLYYVIGNSLYTYDPIANKRTFEGIMNGVDSDTYYAIFDPTGSYIQLIGNFTPSTYVNRTRQIYFIKTNQTKSIPSSGYFVPNKPIIIYRISNSPWIFYNFEKGEQISEFSLVFKWEEGGMRFSDDSSKILTISSTSRHSISYGPIYIKQTDVISGHTTTVMTITKGKLYAALKYEDSVLWFSSQKKIVIASAVSTSKGVSLQLASQDIGSNEQLVMHLTNFGFIFLSLLSAALLILILLENNVIDLLLIRSVLSNQLDEVKSDTIHEWKLIHKIILVIYEISIGIAIAIRTSWKTSMLSFSYSLWLSIISLFDLILISSFFLMNLAFTDEGTRKGVEKRGMSLLQLWILSSILIKLQFGIGIPSVPIFNNANFVGLLSAFNLIVFLILAMIIGNMRLIFPRKLKPSGLRLVSIFIIYNAIVLFTLYNIHPST